MMIRWKLMRAARVAGAWSVLCGACCSSCVGTTGGEVVDFKAAASGPPNAQAGTPLQFSTGLGWQVTLTTATLHVGAVYLDESTLTSGAQPTSCYLPGTYVAQVTQGLDVDLLSSRPQQFPALGHGTTSFAQAGQVWLTQGAIDDPDEPAGKPILTLVGSASRSGDVRPFSATLTISASNRLPNSATTAFATPICKKRVISPIPTTVQVQEQGGLLLQIDPSQLFINVDFSELAPASDGNGYAFVDSSDDSSDQPSTNLFQNLISAGSLYSFSWASDLK